MHIVIIGGSLNAIAAAAHLRRENEKNRITIIDKSSEISTATCGIPSFLQGIITDISELNAASPKLLQQVFNINILLGIDVLQINSSVRTIHLSNGKKLSYDKLLFAVSPLHLRPDIPGILGDNIFTLHNAKAAQHANDYFWGLKAQKVIILGGSRLGIQTAVALATNHGNVTLIEQSPQLLSYVDQEFSNQIKRILEKNSIKVLTSTTIKSFYPKYVTLSDGSRLNYDMAIIATGSHNELRLPLTTDIKIGTSGGILVNDNMQTTVDNIYACGEGIELSNSISHQPFRIRNASLAVQTAKIAADNILGNQNHLPKIFNNEIINVFDHHMGVCGCSEKELKNAEIAYQTVWLNTNLAENYITPEANIKMKLLFNNNGNILGFQVFGSQGVFARLNIVAAIMQKNGKLQDLNDLYLSYNPTMARAKDSLNILSSLALAVQLGDLQTITLPELKKGDILLNLGPKLPEHITNSIEVIELPFIQLRSQMSSLPKKQIIALFCRSGYSSYMAYCLLRSKGFDNVFLLNSPWGWD